MTKVLSGARPAPLNVVAVVYRWQLGRYARTKVNSPLEIEALLGTSRRGASWPRLAVPFVLGIRFPVLLLTTVLPGVVAIMLARGVAESAPPLSVALDLAGTTLALFPIVLLGVVGLWCLLPERRPGGYLHHPGRLWAPSIATLSLTVFLGLLLWSAFPLVV